MDGRDRVTYAPLLRTCWLEIPGRPPLVAIPKGRRHIRFETDEGTFTAARLKRLGATVRIEQDYDRYIDGPPVTWSAHFSALDWDW